jgi:enterochelin esterase-like enzyme
MNTLLLVPVVAALAASVQQPPLTHAQLRDGAATPEAVRRWFGAANLAKGGVKTDDCTVAFAIELADSEKDPKVVSETSSFTLPLKRIGASNVWAAVATLPEGTGFLWHIEVGSEKRGGGQLEVYTTPADAKYHDGVPKGTVTDMGVFKSQVFAGTSRPWWIYVPAQYDPSKPAAVMVFQDGAGPKNYIPPVFDNLIAKGEMPVTIGIFIQPGVFDGGRSNRSVEYDTLSPKYSEMLLTEILPEVAKKYNLSTSPADRAIAGSSSGGICAFTVAWERPDQFSKVLSWVGSFVNLQGGANRISGGHNYPVLVRQSKDKPKPIRVFLQDGANDLDNPFGNWPLANQGMAKALAYSGYDYKLVFGQGFHSGKHGQALLPDSLRWLWRK